MLKMGGAGSGRERGRGRGQERETGRNKAGDTCAVCGRRGTVLLRYPLSVYNNN